MKSRSLHRKLQWKSSLKIFISLRICLRFFPAGKIYTVSKFNVIDCYGVRQSGVLIDDWLFCFFDNLLILPAEVLSPFLDSY